MHIRLEAHSRLDAVGNASEAFRPRLVSKDLFCQYETDKMLLQMTTCELQQHFGCDTSLRTAKQPNELSMLIRFDLVSLPRPSSWEVMPFTLVPWQLYKARSIRLSSCSRETDEYVLSSSDTFAITSLRKPAFRIAHLSPHDSPRMYFNQPQMLNASDIVLARLAALE